MTTTKNIGLRKFPLSDRPDLKHSASVQADHANRITDLSAQPRMGLRGRTVQTWCATNGLVFPNQINGVTAANGLCVARLGQFECLLLAETDMPLPEEFQTLPAGSYSGYRDETWGWFRMQGPDTLKALGSLTSADLCPNNEKDSRVVQTRFAGLDAVLVLRSDEADLEVDILSDIASTAYLVNVFAERCPDFLIVSHT